MLAVASGFDRRERVVRIEVAAARAVLQFRNGVVDRGRALGLLVRALLVAPGVATSAVGRIRTVLPADGFAVGGMTGPAADTRIVWLESGTQVRVTNARCPGRRCVARIARTRSDHVC